MITIHATKKLYAKLPISIQALANKDALPCTLDATQLPRENPLSGWHANLLTLQRRNCVLLVHDSTRFPLFVKGLLKADFANFDRLFADALMNTLLKLEASQEQLDCAAALLAPSRFDTECDRSVQGTMNQMVGDIEHMLWFEEASLDDINSYSTGAWLAYRPCRVKGQKDAIWPDRAMLALMNKAIRQINNTARKDNVVRLADYLSSRDG